MEFNTDEEKSKYLASALSSHKRIRNNYEPMIDEVFKFVRHGRRKVSDKNNSKGKKTGTDIYDGTAPGALNLASDCIHGYLCSSSLHWFDFNLTAKMSFPASSGMRGWSGKRIDEYPEVKVWLDECEEVLYSAYLRSNFYEFHPEYIKEGMSVGTATAIIEEDKSKRKTIFTLPHFRECFIAENAFGHVDTLFRVYTVTLRQLVQKYGTEKVFSLKLDMKNIYEKDPHQDIEIVHATFPRQDYDPEKINGKNKPVASFVLVPSCQNKILDESGFFELPSVTWRWRKNSDEIYGRSPSWDCIVDIKKANQQGMTNLIGGHKMVNPAMVGLSTMRGKVNSNPGGWSWLDGNMKEDMPQPLNSGIQLPYGIDQQDRTSSIIKEHFYVDFFLVLTRAMLNKVEMTATQTMGIQGEQAGLLSTRIGQHQFEGLNEIMDRMFLIEARAGRLPEPPQILEQFQDQPMGIEYTGPLAQSQKRLFKMQGIQAGLEMLTNIAQLYPPAMDRVDMDITIDQALDSVSFPAICIRPEAKVEEIRQMRQQQEAEDRQLEQFEQAAKAGQRLTREVEEDSILDGIVSAEAGEE